ncbi:hypothetical protein SAMN05444162_0141 [Paenibacillaceae bacterium GAS479]|nr:hypothetical protein SAMN05444162_0141 [Paenibacillaceae bacterium GAS479]
MEMYCERCDVPNELDAWDGEKKDEGVKIKCPNCKAEHFLYRRFNGDLFVYLNPVEEATHD